MAKETVQIRLDHDDIQWLDKEAHRMGSSRGAVIRFLIRAFQNTGQRPASEASCTCC